MANYIFRLDDACTTMNKEKWNSIEKIFDKYNVKPIVAIVPNNGDSFLNINNHDNNFWVKVKSWENKGWSIALHGYNHVYCTNKSGIISLHKRSEFAGLSYDQQKEKILKGIKILNEKHIKPTIWVAPSHSFDLNTIKVLKSETNIEIISDGFAYKPYFQNGISWIPMQLWKFKKKKSGLWTICIHPNEIDKKYLVELENYLKEISNSIIGVADIEFLNRKKTFSDKSLSFIILSEFKIKKVLLKWIFKK